MLIFSLLCFQGAQSVGMGKDAQNVQAAADLFEKAYKVLGYSESKIFYQIVQNILSDCSFIISCFYFIFLEP